MLICQNRSDASTCKTESIGIALKLVPADRSVYKRFDRALTLCLLPTTPFIDPVGGTTQDHGICMGNGSRIHHASKRTLQSVLFCFLIRNIKSSVKRGWCG